jgi:hypothetical protein
MKFIHTLSILFISIILFNGCGVDEGGGETRRLLKKNMGLGFNSWNVASEKAYVALTMPLPELYCEQQVQIII